MESHLNTNRSHLENYRNEEVSVGPGVRHDRTTRQSINQSINNFSNVSYRSSLHIPRLIEDTIQ